MKSDYNGLWIPNEILLDDNLSVSDKMVYAYIDCYECDYTNTEIADNLGLSDGMVSKSLHRLISLGYVKVINPRGKHNRVIRRI